MNKPLALIVAGIIALGCLSPSATAQKKPKRGTKPSGDTWIKYKKDKLGEQVVFEDPGETYQPGTAVPLNRRVAVKGLGKFVQPFVGTDPGRLAPGQSGELKIILALKSIYVFQDGMHLALRYRHQQGKISFGNYTLLPPGLGRLKTVYEGLAVYDNTATIIIPVSIGGAAVYGEKTVGFEVEVDVTNGETGVFHGRHTMDVRGKILVGPPLPVIQVSEDEDESTISTQAQVVGASASNSNPGLAQPASAPRTAAPNKPLTTAAESVTGSSKTARAGPDGKTLDLQEGEGGGINLMIYSVPVILLLLILAMALGRGKGKS